MIRTFKILNLIFFILMICINVLANILPIGIGTTGAVSGKYPNLFTPAPITFAIWGVIYIMLALYIVFQMRHFGANEISGLNRVGPWFIISCIMNICWIISWHNDAIWLSVLFIIGLLFSLIVINHLIADSPKTPTLARISIYAFEIYLGWITAATIANISVLLVKMQWTGFGISSQFWTVAVILIGSLLGILFIVTRQRYLSSAAIIWAYCGILIKHISQSGFGGKYPLIIAACIIGIIAIVVVAAIKFVLRIFPQQ